MLDVKDLNIEFHDHLVPETVVHQVSFHMDAGEIVGLVGESGSGKSMTALAIAGLLSRHDMKKTGEILFEGTDLLHCERSFLRELQGNDISVVFQEPMTSLNPVYRIGWQVEEPLRIHHPELSAQERKQRALTLLKQVELEDPERIYQSYPHQISGGMARRVALARAIALDPELVMYDEPFAGLDPISLGTAAQLIRQLNDAMGLTSILVSHDLEVTFALADHVVILGPGTIAAQGTPDEVRNSQDPLVHQFVHALPTGPVPFHYPGPTVAQDFGPLPGGRP